VTATSAITFYSIYSLQYVAEMAEMTRLADSCGGVTQLCVMAINGQAESIFWRQLNNEMKKQLAIQYSQPV